MTRIKRAGLILFLMLCCAVLLTACSGGDSQPTATTAPTQAAKTSVLSFVAANKSTWDMEVTIGDYAYTLAVDLEEGGTLTLKATCTGKAAAQETGGSGGSGGQQAEATEEPVQMTDAENAAQNFTLGGSWTYDKGYGYTITIGDYTTKTSYDRASARQIFYAVITNGNASSSLTQFQGKDVGFRSEIAEDYQDFEVRDAQLIFTGTGTSATGNATSTKVYLEKDGSANSLVQQGSSPTYTRGTWRENADKSLTIELGGQYSADYCDIAGREGYRLTYNSNTMYASVSGEEIAYTDADFDGATLLTLQCAEQDYTVELTEKGFANVFKNGSKDSAGKYTEADGVYTIVLDGTSYQSEGNTITLEFADNSAMASSGGGEPSVRTFNLDGTIPEGGAAAAPADEGFGASDGAPAADAAEREAPVEEGFGASDGAPAESDFGASDGAPAGEFGASDGAPAEGEAPSDGAPAGGE